MRNDLLERVFARCLAEEQLKITEHQFALFQSYYDLLIDWNRKMNLTRVTEREDVYWKHFYDSLTPAFFVDFSNIKTVIDVGSGAGFPSIPLKIMFPHLEVTIVDSLKKRLTFIDALIDRLRLTNVHYVHGRAEDVAKNTRFREQYDVVVARAVARLNVLCEYCLPFTRVGGIFLALKGDRYEEELSEAQRAIRLLGGKKEHQYTLSLPEARGNRAIIQIRKVIRTSRKYPRQAGIPTKSPL